MIIAKLQVQYIGGFVFLLDKASIICSTLFFLFIILSIFNELKVVLQILFIIVQHGVYLLIGVNNPGYQLRVRRIYYACTNSNPLDCMVATSRKFISSDKV